MSLEIYEDPRLYDLVAGSGSYGGDLFVEQARRFGEPVLELACGTGRLTHYLADHGVRVDGLDASAAMLERAREDQRVTWFLRDMRDFDLDRRYALIFIAFNSLLHLHERREHESLLRCVRRHLLPEGVLLLDIFNPDPKILARDPDRRYEVAKVWDEQARAELTLEETTDYDRATQVSHTVWYYSYYPGQPDFRVVDLDLRILFPAELESLLRYNGFEVIERFGSYEGHPFESDSRLQIVLCRPLERRS
jgi:SAM-dependent methyltransferase